MSNKRKRETKETPLLKDLGTGALLFYTANRDGVHSKTTNTKCPLLHSVDRNGKRSILSNFAKTKFRYNGFEVETAENAFQAAKYFKIGEKYREEVLSETNGLETLPLVKATHKEKMQLANAYEKYGAAICVSKSANCAFLMGRLNLTKDGSKPYPRTADRYFKSSAEHEAMIDAFNNGVRSPHEELTTNAREKIMEDVLLCKFAKGTKSMFYLLETGTRVLIEHTSSDCIWGDGGSGLDKEGQNVLGKLLMKIRDAGGRG